MGGRQEGFGNSKCFLARWHSLAHLVTESGAGVTAAGRQEGSLEDRHIAQEGGRDQMHVSCL